MSPNDPVDPNEPSPKGPDVDAILSSAGQQWRAAQPPPPPIRLRPDRQGRGRAGGRWPQLRRWAPAAALASVLLVIGAVTLPGVLREGTAPVGIAGSTTPAGTGFATLPPDRGDGVAVRGAGVLFRAEQGGDLRLCTGIIATADLPTSSAECDNHPISVEVIDADEVWLNHATVNGQAYSDLVSVTGTYHDGVLAIATVTPTTTPGRGTDNPFSMPPCPAPASGWPLGYGEGNGDSNALIEYVRSHDELFNDIWEAHPGGISGPSHQPVSMVYVVGTTGDVDAARKELAALYPGSLCVHQVPYSAAELVRIAEQLRSVSSVAIDAEPDTIKDRVRVTVVVLDEHTVAILKQLGGDAVVLDPPLLQYNG